MLTVRPAWVASRGVRAHVVVREVDGIAEPLVVPRHRELPEAVDGPGKGVRDRSPAGLPGVPADSSMSRTMTPNLARRQHKW